ncbi:unnamed protein product [Polarella glacialis]|uniref:Uncharacterized protein n=1 Tax=Polarella glacialis TaxID=89957 RepID=A0A813IP54_POLGL|nr:unnamed protein product [Polarella glacialis]CAE8654134.1 unnamed protein product [Polarella glacialis]
MRLHAGDDEHSPPVRGDLESTRNLTRQRWLINRSAAALAPVAERLQGGPSEDGLLLPPGPRYSDLPGWGLPVLQSEAAMQEAFGQVEQLLHRKPKPLLGLAAATIAGDKLPLRKGGASSPEHDGNVPRKAASAPGFVGLSSLGDTVGDRAKAEGGSRNPARSVAFKVAARRLMEGEVGSPVPMAGHQVLGLYGPEQHLLVDIKALQSRCELLGGPVSVHQLLERRHQRVQQEQDRLRRQQMLDAATARLDAGPDGVRGFEMPQAHVWDLRQPHAEHRRRRLHQEEMLRRLASTRSSGAGAGATGDAGGGGRRRRGDRALCSSASAPILFTEMSCSPFVTDAE